MAKYNLIKNGVFRSVTISGSYNKELTNAELVILKDDITTSSGISLNTSDYLCMEVDLGQRIKVDGIFLYADDLTKPNNISFQFKNYEEDIFSGATESLTTTYNAIIPEPSAPRYIRCTVSGVNINLFELKILNNDYIIEFGESGAESDTWLDNTPIGIPGTPQAIHIYNNTDNSNFPANAYVCVDATGSGKDNFLKIAKNEEGPYVGFEDGAITGYKLHDWNAGSYDNTYFLAADNTVRLLDLGEYVYIPKGKINTLPLTNCTYLAVPFGIRHPWTYALDRHKIYAVFYTSQDSTSYSVKLYKYDLATNIWSFISDVTFDWVVIANRFNMVYDDHYIYFRGMVDGNSWKRIYRYDLDDIPGNLELMAGYGGNPNSEQNVVMCSDGNGILYEYAADLTSGGDDHFYKYTVATDSWTTLDATLYGPSDDEVKKAILYDTERDVVYLIYIDYSTTWNWVQRYNVALNVWDNYFFDYGTRIGHGNPYLNVSYYNNKIYFFSDDYGSKCYTYDVTTDVVSSIDLEFVFSSSDMVYGLATSPTVSGVGDVSIYATNITGGIAYNMYGYNTGFEEEGIDSYLDPGIGTYTTSVIVVEDEFKSSYFVVEGDTEAGKTSISKASDVYNGSIEVRSSNIEPIGIDYVYWLFKYSDAYIHIGKYDVNADYFDVDFVRLSSTNDLYARSLAVDKKTGRIYVQFEYYVNTQNWMEVFNKEGQLLYSKRSFAEVNGEINAAKHSSVDSAGGIWLHSPTTAKIYHNRFDLAKLGNYSITNVYTLSACFNAESCWFVDSDQSSLVKLNTGCEVVVSVILFGIKGMSSTKDNGCWVVDNEDYEYGNSIKRYSTDGELLFKIKAKETLYRLSTDPSDGFYVGSSTILYHYTSVGVLDREIQCGITLDYVGAGNNGCVIYSSITTETKYYDFDSNSFVWSKNYYGDLFNGTYRSNSAPRMFTWGVMEDTTYVIEMGTKLLPINTDTIWYGDQGLEWKEVQKDGYFLAKNKYHQAKITLRNFDAETTPILKRIALAPAEKIEEILPKTSKPIYVRSDIPADADVSQFDTRIKVWWDVEED